MSKSVHLKEHVAFLFPKPLIFHASIGLVGVNVRDPTFVSSEYIYIYSTLLEQLEQLYIYISHEQAQRVRKTELLLSEDNGHKDIITMPLCGLLILQGSPSVFNKTTCILMPLQHVSKEDGLKDKILCRNCVSGTSLPRI